MESDVTEPSKFRDNDFANGAMDPFAVIGVPFSFPTMSSSAGVPLAVVKSDRLPFSSDKRRLNTGSMALSL